MKSKLVEKAISVAESLIHVPASKYKHFTFLYRRNNIVSVGWNSHRTHPLGKKFGYRFENIHAELAAILNFNDLVNAHRYSVLNLRFLADNRLANSKPCKKCQSLLSYYGFNEVYYSTERGFKHTKIYE